MASIASSSPEILIEHVASATIADSRRVGRHHAAEPHTAPRGGGVSHARRRCIRIASISASVARLAQTPRRHVRSGRSTANTFRNRCRRCLRSRAGTFPAEHPFASVRVVPDGVTLPPIWVLASSGATAAFAGSMGMGYGFARHFSPTPPGPADSRVPRNTSAVGAVPLAARHSRRLDRSARRLPRRLTTWPRPRILAGFASIVVSFSRCPARKRRAATRYSPQERVVVEMNRARHFIGTPETVANMIRNIASDTQADEVMIDVHRLWPDGAIPLLHLDRVRIRHAGGTGGLKADKFPEFRSLIGCRPPVFTDSWAIFGHSGRQGS